MHGLFISYRRDDASAYARLLYERLAREFGKNQIFMDVESIREPGTDFVEAIEKGVGQCGVLLALIGNTWATSVDREGQRRLDSPDDFVRIEIAAALARDVRVMPILVQGANMARPAELPEDLRPLARRQALKLSHDDWEHDVGKLIDALDRIEGFERRKQEPAWRPPPPPLADPAPASAAPAPAPRRRKWPFLAAAAIGAFVVLATALLVPEQVDTTDNFLGRNESVFPIDTRDDRQITVDDMDSRGITQVSAAEILKTQKLLAALDYRPGPADGIDGTATVAAIRAFQSDNGYPVTGAVDAALLTRLEQAVRETKTYEIPARNTVSSQQNLSGIWYDNNGMPVQIVDSGGRLQVNAMNFLTEQFMPIGSGSFDGSTVKIRYNNSGVSGTVVATIAPDGRHLNGNDTADALGVPVPNSWHHNHMPGQ